MIDPPLFNNSILKPCKNLLKFILRGEIQFISLDNKSYIQSRTSKNN